MLWVEVADNVDVSLALLSSLSADRLFVLASVMHASPFSASAEPACHRPMPGSKWSSLKIVPRPNLTTASCHVPPRNILSAFLPNFPHCLPQFSQSFPSLQCQKKSALAYLASLTHLLNRRSDLHASNLLRDLHTRNRWPRQCLSISTSCYRERACEKRCRCAADG